MFGQRDFRPERADFRPERAWGDGRMDGRTNKSPPVFYRTSSPSGPLPCFLSLKFTIMQSRAKGIADHILPLGDWLVLKSGLSGLKLDLSSLKSGPLRPQIKPLGPQTKPLRPKIRPLRPQIRPFKPQASLASNQAS